MRRVISSAVLLLLAALSVAASPMLVAQEGADAPLEPGFEKESAPRDSAETGPIKKPLLAEDAPVVREKAPPADADNEPVFMTMVPEKSAPEQVAIPKRQEVDIIADVQVEKEDDIAPPPVRFVTVKPTSSPADTDIPEMRQTLSVTTKPTTTAPKPTASTTKSTTTTKPTTSKPTTPKPTTSKPTTSKPTTSKPTTSKPTTSKPTTSKPTTSKSTTSKPTNLPPRRVFQPRPIRRMVPDGRGGFRPATDAENAGRASVDFTNTPPGPAPRGWHWVLNRRTGWRLARGPLPRRSSTSTRPPSTSTRPSTSTNTSTSKPKTSTTTSRTAPRTS